MHKIEDPLGYFNDLHILGKRLNMPLLPDPGPALHLPHNLPPLKPDNLEEFSAALDRIDACVQYLMDHVCEQCICRHGVPLTGRPRPWQP